MAVSRRSGRSRATLILLVLTSITLLTLDFRDAPVIGRVRELAAGVFAPVRDAADTVLGPIGDVWNGVTSYGDLESENDELRRRLATLEGERDRNADAAEQLDALLDVVEIPWVADVPSVQARVVAGPASNFVNTVELDKGTDDGVTEGMPVVVGAGLLGRVVQASGGTATVQLITDPEFRVGVRLGSTGALGTATGTGPRGHLVVDTGVEADAEVRTGTRLYTSGADRSAFPASIPVGTVSASREAPGGLTLELEARPSADVDRASFVSVLRWVDGAIADDGP